VYAESFRRYATAIGPLSQRDTTRSPETIGEEHTHLVGTPERVIEQIQGFADLGVGEVAVEFVDFPETDGAELFADEVIPEFSASRRLSPVYEVLSHVISNR
jgi:alkanesulfonate monooxygenase SsuD/methylene tetrahydromethanopterin reductase-like flavin-dependent oxidoreductase (luciferase family)